MSLILKVLFNNLRLAAIDGESFVLHNRIFKEMVKMYYYIYIYQVLTLQRSKLYSQRVLTNFVSIFDLMSLASVKNACKPE